MYTSVPDWLKFRSTRLRFPPPPPPPHPPVRRLSCSAGWSVRPSVLMKRGGDLVGKLGQPVCFRKARRYFTPPLPIGGPGRRAFMLVDRGRLPARNRILHHRALRPECGSLSFPYQTAQSFPFSRSSIAPAKRVATPLRTVWPTSRPVYRRPPHRLT